jgi:NAD(P)H-hydrate epimerase
VLVIGGSELYTGAPSLCALAALRTGADLAYVAAPERAADNAARNIDLITVKLPGKKLLEKHATAIKPWLGKADAVAIGPGLGEDAATKKAVLKIIKLCKKPVVLDADGLKALKGNLSILKGKQIVLTPHAKEFELIFGQKATKANVKKLAGKGIVILLKGPEDIISDGTNVKVNRTGNPGMTVGGTGDVLAGVVAGLIAQGKKPYEAAQLAAWINGSAGDLCRKELGFGFMASDLIEKIPKVMRWSQR